MTGPILTGLAAAPGRAVGSVRLPLSAPSASGRLVADARRPEELELARRSLAAAGAELDSLGERLLREGRQEEAEIVATGSLMAADPELDGVLMRLVLAGGRSAPVALLDASDAFAAELALLPDPLLAERADDVRSLGRRAARHAAGIDSGDQGGVETVLVAESLGPADVAELGPEVVAIALAGGGVRAHAAIVARSLGLPMVVGAGPSLLAVLPGQAIVVDGDAGTVQLAPQPAQLRAARDAAGRDRLERERARSERRLPVETVDGRRLRLLANASTLPELKEALEQGAQGVGLLRTELLFLDSEGWPDMAAQRRFLRPLLALLGGRIATVRLYDFGGDKTPPFLAGTEERGVELLLAAPGALRAQLQAILEVAADSELRILVPMVSSVTQMSAVRAVIDELLSQQPDLSRPLLGAMIEAPPAVHEAERLAAVCDFFSIGTNDLTALALGGDRSGPGTAPAYHPEVLRLVAATTRAAAGAGIPVEVCGEAASDPISLPILVGLGVDELSVGAARVGMVRRWVRGLDWQRTKELATRALGAGAPQDVERLVGELGHAVGERR